jgi:putative lipoprotein
LLRYSVGMRNVRIVQSEIALPTGDLPSQAAEVAVYVEDVSRADAPSLVVGEQRQQAVPLRAGGALRFSIQIPAELINERSIYSVRAHIDMSGSGDVKVGDLVSTATYPVLTHGHGTTVRIKVQRV